MPLDILMKLDLLQELLMALRASEADGYMSWQALGLEELGRDAAAEVESEWPVYIGCRREGQADCMAQGVNPLSYWGIRQL